AARIDANRGVDGCHRHPSDGGCARRLRLADRRLASSLMKRDAAQLKSEIRDWWASAPMTYAQDHGATLYHRPDGTVERVELGSRRFFELADETFYRWNEPIRGPEGPFGRIFDYQRYRDAPVLEVGCGMGCMAMNWAQRGARLTAVDLNPV